MSQLLKKTLSGIASVTTILWSVGGGLLALPGAASAATIVAGDLVKSPTASDVYYYAADGKRYVFPNEKTYKSWYADFSTVKTITGAELAALPLGANVTIRPGTKLVKITTDPKVYAVAPNGTLRWIETEAIAIALYGSNWAQRVVDVPDGYFVNYTVGASVSSAVHPDGTVVMYSGSSDMFVVWGGQKRKLVGDAFMMNGYQMSDVIVTTASYPMGTDVTGRESALANTVNPGSVTAPVVGGTLMISLASDTPAGMTLPKNAASAQLAKFNLMAGSGNVMVTGMRFHRVGIGATTDLSNVYLYDGNGNRLTTGRTVNSTTNNVEFNSLNLNVAAGQTMSVVLVADLSSPSSTGGQHSFELVDAASVVVTGGSTVAGSFPVRGNVFTVGTSSAGTITVERGNTLSNPNIGSAEAEISSFKLTSNLHDLEVRRVTLLSAGSVSNSDLSDFKLYQGTTLVATAATMSGDKIVLNFVPPYVITNGTSRIFTLKAKVAGRSARTIRTYVEYSTDVYAIDRTYNTGAAVTITSYDGDSGSASSCSGTEESCVTTQGGQLTVTFNGPTAQNISRGAQDVVLYRFSLASPESNLEIRNLRFKIASTNSARVRGSSNTDYFTDIKVKNMANGQTLMGPTSLPATLSSVSDSGTITLSDSFNMTTGQILDLAITADLSNSEDADHNFFANGTSTYQVTLGPSSTIFGSSDVRITDTGEYLALAKIVPNTFITGNTMTVKPSSLALAMVSNPSSGTVVKNSSSVPVAGFSFTAGSQTDNIITAITLKAVGDINGSGASYTLAEADDVVTGCGLFDGDTQIGQSRAPDSTTGEMSITSLNLRIVRGTTKTLVVKCSTVSSVSASGYRIAVGISAVTAQDADANTVTVTVPAAISAQYAESGASRVNQNVISGGTLTITTNSLRTATILVAGNDTWQNVAEYRATAQNEDVRIEKIAVSSTGDAASYQRVAIAMDGAVKGSAEGEILPSGAMRYKTVDLTSSPINVMRNTSVNFNIWTKLDAVQASSTVNQATTGVPLSGLPVSLGIASGITTGDDAWDSNYNDKMNVRAVGIGSGNLVYATSSSMGATLSGNTFVVRKSKPTVTQQALSTTTLVSGQQMDLYKFQVSADSAGSVTLKKVTFAVSVSTTTGSSLTLSNFRIRKGSTEVPIADVIITDGVGTNIEAGDFGAATTTPRVVVSFTNSSGGGEEGISGSGTVYTLVATTAGPIVAGDQVTTSIDRSGDISAGNVTGYLTSTYSGSLVGPNLDTAIAPGATVSGASFIWSDQSEIPHSDQVGASGGSRDWTNGYLVDDLTRSQSLTR
ncbi:hypothetical protein KBD61_01480 [Patescibacteria group bacterium]|nr:hypothetical protein [Patescibacteria group bacterium]MBP9709680.1 hypothetical protein [Patescibacteria group bacterium]